MLINNEVQLLERELDRLKQQRRQIIDTDTPYASILNSQIDLLKCALNEI